MADHKLLTMKLLVIFSTLLGIIGEYIIWFLNKILIKPFKDKLIMFIINKNGQKTTIGEILLKNQK